MHKSLSIHANQTCFTGVTGPKCQDYSELEPGRVHIALEIVALMDRRLDENDWIYVTSDSNVLVD